MRKSIALRLGGALLGLLLWTGVCAAAEFTADCVHSSKSIGSAKNSHQGTGNFTSKLYVKGEKEREEIDRGKGGKSIIITRKDKGVVWVLFPGSKEYMESKYNAGELGAGFGMRPHAMMGMHDHGDRATAPKPPAPKKKSLGKAKVNGYSCDKYQITSSFKRPGSDKSVTVTTTVCESSQLGRPIRMETKSPEFTSLMELKNIKQTKLSDSLFEIPKGYKKRTMSNNKFGPGTGPPPGR